MGFVLMGLGRRVYRVYKVYGALSPKPSIMMRIPVRLKVVQGSTSPLRNGGQKGRFNEGVAAGSC